MDHQQTPEDLENLPPEEPKIEINLFKLCFICLNNLVIHRHDGDDGHDQEFDFLLQRKEDSRSNCVNVLTSYILQSASSSNSKDNRDGERDNLQRSILSSINNGKLSICPECLSKAEHLMSLHTELEKIQTEILEVLKGLQNYLKTSNGVKGGDGNPVVAMLQDDASLSLFQNILRQQFMSRENFEWIGNPSSLFKLHPGNPTSLVDDLRIIDIDAPQVKLEDGDGGGRPGEADEIIISDELQFGHDDDEDDDDSHDNDLSAEECGRDSLKWKKREGLPNPEYSSNEEEEDLTTEDDGNQEAIGSPWKKSKLEPNDPGKRTGRKQTELKASLTCTECKKTFKDKINLRRHIKRVHSQACFRCPHCPKVLKSENGFNYHQKSHLKEGKVQPQKEVKVKIKKIREREKRCEVVCDNCGKVYKNKHHLNIHVKLMHEDLKFACDLCPKKCRNQTSLNYHKKTVHEREEVQCPHCGKKLKNTYSLQLHIRRRHGFETQCQFCGKTFTNKERFQRHEDAHRKGKKKFGMSMSMPIAKEVKVKFIKREGKIDGTLLVCDGYIFGKTYTHNKTTLFKCTHRIQKKGGCQASIAVHDFDLEKLTYSIMETKEVGHNHPAQPEEVTRWEVRSRLRELLASNPEAMPEKLVKIIEQEFCMDAEEARNVLGSYGSFKKFIRRVKNKDNV